MKIRNAVIGGAAAVGIAGVVGFASLGSLVVGSGSDQVVAAATEYILVGPEGQKVDGPRSDVDPNVATKEGYKWLPVEREAAPDYDPATEVRSGLITAVEKDKVVLKYDVRPKTEEEIDREKDSAVGQVGDLGFDVDLDVENRLRKLEGQPAITADEYRAILKGKL